MAVGRGEMAALHLSWKELYAALTQAPLPDIEGMGYVEADVWTRARWNEYMAMLP